MDGTKKKRALVSPQVLPAGRGSGALLEFRWTPAEEGSSVGTAQGSVDAEAEGCRAARGAKSPRPLQ